MRIWPLLVAIGLALASAGCGSVVSTVDGRCVTGKCVVYATMRSDGHEATVDLDGKKVQVTSSEITWDRGGTLHLPDGWSRLELADAAGTMEVDIDGQRFARIQPAQ